MDHVFNPTPLRVARAGLNYLHTTCFSGQTTSPIFPDNSGFRAFLRTTKMGTSAFGIQGLQTLGSNAFAFRRSQFDDQFTDDFTKFMGHTFKMGSVSACKVFHTAAAVVARAV
jgi:hypothetical protein